MTVDFLLTILLASVLGSTHCAGMCGPFVVMAAGGRAQGSALGLRLGAYHVGRLFTYGVLGLLAGILGTSLNRTGELWGLQKLAAYLAGLAMLLSALILFLRQIGVRIQHLPLPQGWVQLVQAGFRHVARWSAVPRAFALGTLTTWLPCGWLYAFVLVAAGMGQVSSAVTVMAAFWLGTLPLLSMVGWGSAQLAPRLRPVIPWIAMMACFVLGILTLTHRTQVSWLPWQTSLEQQVHPAERLQRITKTKPPCCQDD